MPHARSAVRQSITTGFVGRTFGCLTFRLGVREGRLTAGGVCLLCIRLRGTQDRSWRRCCADCRLAQPRLYRAGLRPTSLLKQTEARAPHRDVRCLRETPGASMAAATVHDQAAAFRRRGRTPSVKQKRTKAKGPAIHTPIFGSLDGFHLIRDNDLTCIDDVTKERPMFA